MAASTNAKFLELEAARTGARACERRGDATVLELDLRLARRVGGWAFELELPDVIAGDEITGPPERAKRSTLQLYLMADGDIGSPLGPAHALHDRISREGGGAYSHWREEPTFGTGGRSRLRFSTPGNVSLSELPGTLVAVVFPLAPSLGFVDVLPKRAIEKRVILHREMFMLSLRAVGAPPHVIGRPSEVRPGTTYLWRPNNGANLHRPQSKLSLGIMEHGSQFEERGAVLFPPVSSFLYYQDKVTLTELFQQRGVKTPRTWVFTSAEEALASAAEIEFPVVIKNPFGFSSYGIKQVQQRDKYADVIGEFFAEGARCALVQRKVTALREVRVTYVGGRPVHGYWRQRQSLADVSAASTQAGSQDFNLDLAALAGPIARFANATGVPVGGVDIIWPEANPDLEKDGFVLEVSPTFELNPPPPPGWNDTYAAFKDTPTFFPAWLAAIRYWTDQMVLAVLDRHRLERKTLFVEVDNVVAESSARLQRHAGAESAFVRDEVIGDTPVPDAAKSLRLLRSRYFVRFLAARGRYPRALNVTMQWLDLHGFEYDEVVIVGDSPEEKLCHLSASSVLVDAFRGQRGGNDVLVNELRARNLRFVHFTAGRRWADIVAEL